MKEILKNKYKKNSMKMYSDSKVNINLYRNKFIRKGNIIER